MADNVLAATASAPGQICQNLNPRWVRNRREHWSKACSLGISAPSRKLILIQSHRQSTINDECVECNSRRCYWDCLGGNLVDWSFMADISAGSPSVVLLGTLKT